MEKEALNGLVEIAKQSNNDIITLLIIIVVSIPFVVIYMRAKSSEKHARHKEQMERETEAREREKNLIKVISDNTTAFVELSTLLKSNNQNCTECRAEQTAINKEILEGQKELHIDIIKIKERI